MWLSAGNYSQSRHDIQHSSPAHARTSDGSKYVIPGNPILIYKGPLLLRLMIGILHYP